MKRLDISFLFSPSYFGRGKRGADTFKRRSAVWEKATTFNVWNRERDPRVSSLLLLAFKSSARFCWYFFLFLSPANVKLGSVSLCDVLLLFSSLRGRQTKGTFFAARLFLSLFPPEKRRLSSRLSKLFCSYFCLFLSSAERAGMIFPLV